MIDEFSEDPNMRITEIQNELENYKDYADTRIIELEDKLERVNFENQNIDELMHQV